MKTNERISSLVDELEPVRPVNTARTAALSWIFALGATAVCMLLVAPFRTGFVEQLLSTPRFALETVVGLVVGILFVRAAFELAVPDRRSQRLYVTLAAVLGAFWLALFAFAFIEPALPPSMAGKRHECYYEAMAISLPMTVIAIFMLRRMYVLNGLRTGLFAGIAAGVLPAFLMQLACMHEPWHTITHHVAPIGVSAVAGAVLGAWLLRRRQ
ncbi:MAG: NrsF family protein [Pseudomonadota bacterium]